MAKIFSYIFFFIFILNEMIQAVPLTADDDDDDIMVASSRLHRQADRFHHFNSIPNIMNFPSENFAPQYKPNYNYRVAREEEEEPETVYIDMKVDSEEELETQYVNLFIDIVRN